MIGSASEIDPVALENHRKRQKKYREKQKMLAEASRDSHTSVIRDVEIRDKSIDNNIFVSGDADTSENEEPERDEKGYTLEDRFDFIRGLYPKVRRGSRAKALKTYKKYITTGHKYCDSNIKLTEKQIYNAVLEYIRQQEEKKTEPVYYKNFETLMNQVSDYVIEEGSNE